MNEKNDEYLCKTYPKIFRDRHGDMKVTCMVWGFPGDGWFDLLDALCKQLQWNTDKNGYPQVTARQVKEKFGGLRFYYGEEGGEDNKWLAHKSGIIEGMISFAETMSYKICEKCGSNINVSQNEHGYILTLCKKCREGKNERG